MDDEPAFGPVSRPHQRDRGAVLAAARNILARHHHKVTGGSAAPGTPLPVEPRLAVRHRGVWDGPPLR